MEEVHLSIRARVVSEEDEINVPLTVTVTLSVFRDKEIKYKFRVSRACRLYIYMEPGFHLLVQAVQPLTRGIV